MLSIWRFAVLLAATVLAACSSKDGTDEYALYRQAGARCGPALDEPVRVGFERWAAWSNSKEKGAFRDAGMTFEHLYKSGCRDGLVVYRYGNLMRLKDRCEQAIAMIGSSLPDLEAQYGDRELNYAHAGIAQCSTSLGRHDDAIRHYRMALEHDANDVNSMLNLATRYYWKKDCGNATAMIARAEANRNLNSYGRKVADDLRTKLKPICS